MPKIDLSQSHALPIAEVRRRVDEVKGELESKYGLACKWDSDTQMSVSGKGVTGTIKVQPAVVAVNLDLSFLLSPMKGKIEERLKTQLAAKLK
jgi:putative polyhydroxyalkanoate system protein